MPETPEESKLLPALQSLRASLPAMRIWRRSWEAGRVPAEIFKRNTQVATTVGGEGPLLSLPRVAAETLPPGSALLPSWADVCQGRLSSEVFFQEVPGHPLWDQWEHTGPCREWCLFLLPMCLDLQWAWLDYQNEDLEISLVLDMSDSSERAFLLNWLVREYVTFTFPRPLGMPKQHKLAEFLVGKELVTLLWRPSSIQILQEESISAGEFTPPQMPMDSPEWVECHHGNGMLRSSDL